MFIAKRTLRQGMTILPSALVNFSFGFVFGWVSPAMEYLKSENSPFEVTSEELSWIASAYFATEASSWFLLVMANSPTMIIASRALMGVAAGTHDMIWCMYVGEVTTPVERGFYGSLMMSLFLGGVMITFFLSLCVPFVYLAIIPCAISTLTFLLKFFIKETPFHLIKRGKFDAAIRNLAWLRGKDDPKSVQVEFDEIKKFIEEDENKASSGIMQVLRQPSQYKVAIVGVLIFTIAQPSGNIGILSFQTTLLDLFDESRPGADLTVIYGVLQFACINLAPFIIEKIGRKAPMTFGFAITALIHVALAYLFYAGEYQLHNIPHMSYIICGLFNLYGVIFAITILPTIYVLKSELFPTEIKSLANFSATMANALVEFVVVKLFTWIWYTFGLYVNFVIYAVICVVSVVYVQLLIPETRGKTLIEIQEKIRRQSQMSKKISNVSSVSVSNVTSKG